VGTGLVGAPACGDVMKLQIQVQDGKIVKSVFKTFGCGSAIASSSVATEWVQGKTLDEALEIKNQDIAKHLNLPSQRTPPVSLAPNNFPVDKGKVRV
jgi:nitrogen fixation NifU-like protein